MTRLARSFFARPARIVARELLGAELRRRIGETWLVGRIVETEAYGANDPASHGFRGRTPRTNVMFGPPGFSYIYFTYGMHHCFNVTCDEEGLAEAVLIRGIEPLEGIETMRKFRPGITLDRNLTNGPGKICQAFNLARTESGIDLLGDGEIILAQGKQVPSAEIVVTSRIGISLAKDEQWRFYIRGNRFVSPGKPSGELATGR